MDYEKLIEQLKGISNGLAEDEFPKCANAVRQASTALSMTQAENEKLRDELEQVKRERDITIEQLHGHCPACIHYTPNHNEGPCQFCCFEIARGTNVEINDNWKWRGPKEE